MQHESHVRIREQLRQALAVEALAAFARDESHLADGARATLRRSISGFVSARRKTSATPEAVLIELKHLINSATTALDVETRRRAAESIVAWAIEDYYSAR